VQEGIGADQDNGGRGGDLAFGYLFKKKSVFG